ncbi:MAG TPA: hypothetical protein PL166_02445, partial [Candidatus Contendobacter sp.]|nr:hypothetical protein [Candidatus Contendobacter sp.]
QEIRMVFKNSTTCIRLLYFMPGTENDLSESDYLSCGVKVGTVLDPDNKTTAHVVAVLYRP